MEIHKNLQDQKSEVYLKLEQNMGCELWEDGFMKLEYGRKVKVKSLLKIMIYRHFFTIFLDSPML